jgi:hypothetical protein
VNTAKLYFNINSSVNVGVINLRWNYSIIVKFLLMNFCIESLIDSSSCPMCNFEFNVSFFVSNILFLCLFPTFCFCERQTKISNKFAKTNRLTESLWKLYFVIYTLKSKTRSKNLRKLFNKKTQYIFVCYKLFVLRDMLLLQ